MFHTSQTASFQETRIGTLFPLDLYQRSHFTKLWCITNSDLEVEITLENTIFAANVYTSGKNNQIWAQIQNNNEWLVSQC